MGKKLLPSTPPTTGLTKLDAFTEFLSIAFKDSERIWLKHGMYTFFTGLVNYSQPFAIDKVIAPKYNTIATYSDGFKVLSNLSHSENGGIFFIPGKPDSKPQNEFIFESDLLSAELDNGTADEQWQIIREFYNISGLAPSIILTSGGKSFHIHNKLPWKLPIAERTYLMRLFCVALGSDPAVTSPHQPMRAPGFFRKEKNSYQVLVHSDRSAIFTPDQWLEGLRLVFDAKGLEFPESISDEQFRVYKALQRDGLFTPESWSSQALHPPEVTRSYINTERRYEYEGAAIVPLETFLTRDDQHLLATGISEGGRNNAGYKLAANLFATANRLEQLNVRFNGYPENLFEDFCNRCSPPLSGWERQTILRSVTRSQAKIDPSLPDDALLDRASWYEYANGLRGNRNGYGHGCENKNYGNRLQPGEISKEEFVKRFGELGLGLSDSDADNTATATADNNKPKVKSPYEYWGYLKKRVKDMTQSVLDYGRSLGSKWGDLYSELPEMGDSDILPHSISGDRSNTKYYSQGQRIAVWSDLVATGAKYIFDRSTMGLGKSYDAGLLEPSALGVNKLIYVAAEHRNVTTQSLESWSDLVPRHNGLVHDEHGKLRRRVDVTEPWAVKPNCVRTGLLALLRDRNIESADAASTICQSCPHFEGCSSGTGEYTYLRDRGDVLQKNRFRCHPASLPPVDQFEYSPDSSKTHTHKKPVRHPITGEMVLETPVLGIGLIWEEWSQILTDSRTITANVGDVNQLLGYIANVNLDLAKRIQPITAALVSLMDTSAGNQGAFGWNHYVITKKLEKALGLPQSEWSSLFSDLIIELDQWTSPDGAIDQLFSIGDELDGVNIADLPRAVRDRLGKSEAELIAQASATILKQWLPEFLGVMSGLDTGLCNINFDTLTITICNKQLIHIARSAAFNIFLDATEMPSNLAAILGVDVSEIATVAQESEPSNNFCIFQITDIGRLGSGRGNEQVRRKDAVLSAIAKDHPDLTVIDWKKFLDPDSNLNQYCWWRDSRGNNDIYNNGVTNLALVGIPTKPLEQYRAQFACRFGYVPDAGEEEVTRWVETAAGYLPFTDSESSDPLFRQFIYDDIQSTIEQGIGRLRASRRPDEQLNVWLIGDFAHRFPVTVIVPAHDITPEATSKTQALEMAILKAAQQIKQEQFNGSDVEFNLTSIAVRVGKSLSHLSKTVRKLGYKSAELFLETLQTLLGISNSKRKVLSSVGSPASPHPEHLTSADQYLLNHYIPLAYDKLRDNPEALIPEVLRHIFDHAAEYGKQCLPRILNALPHPLRQDILQFFFLLFPLDELEELIT